jgi:hypothetical protein
MYELNYSHSEQRQYLPVPDQIRDPWRIPPESEKIQPPRPETPISDDDDGGMEYPLIIKKKDKRKIPISPSGIEDKIIILN